MLQAFNSNNMYGPKRRSAEDGAPPPDVDDPEPEKESAVEDDDPDTPNPLLDNAWDEAMEILIEGDHYQPACL